MKSTKHQVVGLIRWGDKLGRSSKCITLLTHGEEECYSWAYLQNISGNRTTLNF